MEVPKQLTSNHEVGQIQVEKSNESKGKAFEDSVRNFLRSKTGLDFKERRVNVSGVDYKFDLVDETMQILGEAKFLKNIKNPAAKWDSISTYVWLLQHAKAEVKFIVFGRDRAVSERWLKRFAPLIREVEFYYLDMNGIELLSDQSEGKLMNMLKQ